MRYIDYHPKWTTFFPPSADPTIFQVYCFLSVVKKFHLQRPQNFSNGVIHPQSKKISTFTGTKIFLNMPNKYGVFLPQNFHLQCPQNFSKYDVFYPDSKLPILNGPRNFPKHGVFYLKLSTLTAPNVFQVWRFLFGIKKFPPSAAPDFFFQVWCFLAQIFHLQRPQNFSKYVVLYPE